MPDAVQIRGRRRQGRAGPDQPNTLPLRGLDDLAQDRAPVPQIIPAQRHKAVPPAPQLQRSPCGAARHQRLLARQRDRRRAGHGRKAIRLGKTSARDATVGGAGKVPRLDHRIRPLLGCQSVGPQDVRLPHAAPDQGQARSTRMRPGQRIDDEFLQHAGILNHEVGLQLAQGCCKFLGFPDQPVLRICAQMLRCLAQDCFKSEPVDNACSARKAPKDHPGPVPLPQLLCDGQHPSDMPQTRAIGHHHDHHRRALRRARRGLCAVCKSGDVRQVGIIPGGPRCAPYGGAGRDCSDLQDAEPHPRSEAAPHRRRGRA